MRLIDADVLKDWLEIVPLTYDGGIDIDDLIEHIDLMTSAQPELIRCNSCRHDNNCEIQYAAQAGSKFFCGAAERREE